MRIGILHPGDMGASVGFSARQAGNRVFWASENRSGRTRARAEQAELADLETLHALLKQCEIVVSVCPPVHSRAQALSVSECGFDGIYVEANAISPQASSEIAQLFANTSTRYVDGGIVGAPAWDPGTTRLYLSGADATAVSSAFSGGPLEPRVLDDRVGTASAMKMCYAAFTKGQTALIASILTTADFYGVSNPLVGEWGEESTSARIANIQRVSGRAWRWVDEMNQIADTMAAAGIHDGIHRAAADLYSRLDQFKDVDPPPDWPDILNALKPERD